MDLLVDMLRRCLVSALSTAVAFCYGANLQNVLCAFFFAAGGGTQCIIPYRGDDMEWRHLKVSCTWSKAVVLLCAALLSSISIELSRRVGKLHVLSSPLQPMGDIGVVVPVPFSPRDPVSLRRVIKGSDIVINLIGKVGRATFL
jgi:hypothetical protein